MTLDKAARIWYYVAMALGLSIACLIGVVAYAILALLIL